MIRFVTKALAVFCGWFCVATIAAETIPPAPAQYFNDYAGVVSAGTTAQLNERLKQFERDSSCQIVVAIYPKMQSDSSIEDYSVRTAQAWKVGQQDKRNGAVLFVFIQDRKMFLQVGYGLEGALPDAICKRIIDEEITPAFKAGNFDAGLTAGVNAILAAAKGEYRGTGQIVSERGRVVDQPGFVVVAVIALVAIFVALTWSKGRRGGYYSRGGWSAGSWGGGWSSGGGGWSSGGGGGGFSGGGGSFGGGGAGGSW